MKTRDKAPIVIRWPQGIRGREAQNTIGKQECRAREGWGGKIGLARGGRRPERAYPSAERCGREGTERRQKRRVVSGGWREPQRGERTACEASRAATPRPRGGGRGEG